MTGDTMNKDYRGQQVRLGEVIAYRNLFWSLSEAMARHAVGQWRGTPQSRGSLSVPCLWGDVLSDMVGLCLT
jgi:hypothetical protein